MKGSEYGTVESMPMTISRGMVRAKAEEVMREAVYRDMQGRIIMVAM